MKGIYSGLLWDDTEYDTPMFIWVTFAQNFNPDLQTNGKWKMIQHCITLNNLKMLMTSTYAMKCSSSTLFVIF